MFDEDRDVNRTKKKLADWIFDDKLVQFRADGFQGLPVLFAQEDGGNYNPALPTYAVKYLYCMVDDFGLSFTHLAVPKALAGGIKKINPKLNLCEFEIQKNSSLVKLHGNNFGKGGEAILFTPFFTGELELQAVKLLRSSGLKVNKIICLINVAPGNGELIRDVNCEIFSRFNIRKLIHYYFQEERITKKQHRDSILMFIGPDVLGEDF